MKVKLISVDTNHCYFHRLTDALNEALNEWLNENPSIDLVSVTPAFHNVEDGDDNIAVMTATIIYN